MSGFFEREVLVSSILQKNKNNFPDLKKVKKDKGTELAPNKCNIMPLFFDRLGNMSCHQSCLTILMYVST